MKQLLTFLLSLLLLLGPLTPARAQRPAATAASSGPSPLYLETPSRAQRTADSLMANLDKSQIPTGVLYDRVAGLAALDVFNRCYNNPDTSSVGHFMQAYYEMHCAPYAIEQLDAEVNQRLPKGRPCLRNAWEDEGAAAVRGHRPPLGFAPRYGGYVFPEEVRGTTSV